MNTKKDYLRAVEVVREHKVGRSRDEVMKAFIQFFQGDNPRFDVERFRAACQKE